MGNEAVILQLLWDMLLLTLVLGFTSDSCNNKHILTITCTHCNALIQLLTGLGHVLRGIDEQLLTHLGSNDDGQDIQLKLFCPRTKHVLQFSPIRGHWYRVTGMGMKNL